MDEKKRLARCAASEKWRKANMEKVRKAQRARYWRNHEKFLEAGRKWREENREKSRLSARNWQMRNPEKHKKDHSIWCRANSYRRSAKQSARKAGILHATPKWANEFFIDEIYHLAALRTKMLGFPWHVDHVVPLNSPLVCGLHVEHNLRVIPASENIKKHNRHWPNMP